MSKGRRGKIKRPKKTPGQKFTEMTERILKVIDIQFKFTNDFDSALKKADQFINVHIHSHPEEKDMVIRAAKQVRECLEEAMDVVGKRESDADQGSDSGSAGSSEGEGVVRSQPQEQEIP